MMKKIFYIILFISLLIGNNRSFAQSLTLQGKVDLVYEPEAENLDVFQQWILWNNPQSLLIDLLTKEAEGYYDIRDGEIAKLRTGDDWMKRQELVRAKLIEMAGPFPEKTPLNPKITGRIKKDGYTIEKIVYESMPGFYVTGCVFVPDKINRKAPAILNVIGHNQEAFRAELYQVLMINLAKKGMIVLAIDPPGQGENIQNFDPAINFSNVGYSVVEHCYFGNQCFLSGVSCAKYFIWDGIRGIDYLISRKDVDRERIGVTGFSGGGTITSYISAFDERVKVSVPCSWATANRRVLETKGAQDAETVFTHGLVKGITFEDFIEVRAPKPTLMTFTSRDQYLSLQGAREAYAEAKNAYKALGEESNLQFVEDDFQHWMTPKIRREIYGFFMKHFNLNGSAEEEKVELLSQDDLKVTPTGQIFTSYGGQKIFDVNLKENEKLINDLESARKDIGPHLKDVNIKAKEISGYNAPDAKVKALINGRYQREGYSVGKYALTCNGDYAIPVLLFVPAGDINSHPAMIYLHPQGKIKEALPGGEIEKLVKQGYIVAAADLLGVGEVKNTASRGISDGYTAILTGRSIVGIQAGNITEVVNFLKELPEVDPIRIGAIGIDEMCIPLIHAAAFNNNINCILLSGSLISYRSVAMNRGYKIGMTARENGGTHHPYELDFSWGVAGALEAYDLPDLIGCIAPRKVVVAGPRDQTLSQAADDVVKVDMAFPVKAFAFASASDNLKIVPSVKDYSDLINWCFK